jgi:hypothetical protein
LRGEVCFGAIQASVTALSITCRWTLLHSGQVNVRKSWPGLLGSIAVNFISEPQAVHCGPWFCASSIVVLPSVRRSEFSGEPTGRIQFDGIGCSDAYLDVIASGHSNNRCSKPIGPDETRSSIMRVWQREQRGRSIAVKNCWDEGTRLPRRWAGARHSQSPVAADMGR